MSMFDLKGICECGHEFPIQQQMVRTFEFTGGDVQEEDGALYVTAYWCPKCKRFILAQLDNSVTKQWLEEVKNCMATMSRLKMRGYEGKKIKRNQGNAKWLSEKMATERARLLAVYAGTDVVVEGKHYKIPRKVGQASMSNVPVIDGTKEGVLQ